MSSQARKDVEPFLPDRTLLESKQGKSHIASLIAFLGKIVKRQNPPDHFWSGGHGLGACHFASLRNREFILFTKRNDTCRIAAGKNLTI